MGWKTLRGRRTTIYSPYVTLIRLLKMGGNTVIVDMTACYIVTFVTVKTLSWRAKWIGQRSTARRLKR